MRNERRLISIGYYSFMFLVIVIEWFSGHMIHQFQQAVLIRPAADNMYWLLHLLCMPQLIAGTSNMALTFEILWAIIAVSCIVFQNRVFLNIVFTLFFLVFMVTKNSLAAHQEHGLNAAFLMSFIFWTLREERFVFLFKAFRYYVLFIFVSAACWKIFRGSVFNTEQFSEVLKSQHVYFLSQQPEGIYYSLITFLINHAAISYGLFLAAILLQLIFMVGFFTRKYDRRLLILFFLFFAGDWLLMGLSFYQTYIAALVFFNWKFLSTAIKGE